MIALLILILILGILIFVHELGHYLAAKWAGVYVHEFALGMGPKIFSFRRKNDPTLYSLRAFPIGGFCAMAGEVEEDEKDPKIKIKKDQYMCNKTKWQRFVILFSGVFLNFVLAFLLLFMQSLIWGHREQRSYIGFVPEGLPAAEAGIREGDRVLSINGHRINNWDRLQTVLHLRNDSGIFTFVVLTPEGEETTHEVTPNVEVDEDGNERNVFGIGSSPTMHRGFGASLSFAWSRLWTTISTMVFTIGSLITGNLSLSALSGPVGMHGIVGDSARVGISALIALTAFLSINLGVINLLPFPAVDGGRIVFIGIEAITGKKVNQKFENIMHLVGFALLMLLMLYVTVMDIFRLF